MPHPVCQKKKGLWVNRMNIFNSWRVFFRDKFLVNNNKIRSSKGLFYKELKKGVVLKENNKKK